MNSLLLWLVLAICLVAVCYVMFNYIRIKRMPEGTDRMIKMSAIIRDGANVFIKKEFTTIAIVVGILAVLFTLFIERTSGLTFLFGACMSSFVCILGMKSATYANVRTANKARETLSIGETVKVALCGGSISGLSVQACGLFGITIIVLIGMAVGVGNVAEGASGIQLADLFSQNDHGFLAKIMTNGLVMRVTTYSLGCSIVAMFNRVAGGNYTKAADISADILGKIRNDLPEDDSRVPNVIADFIGDNVNDIAGNCSDLLESFVATIAASIVVSIGFLGENSLVSIEMFSSLYQFPILFAGVGLLGCVIGLIFVSLRKMSNNPSKELNLATYISAGLAVVGCGLLCYFMFNKYNGEELGNIVLRWWKPWICAILGIASGVAIGAITEYYTSADYAPTKTIAEYATEGEAFVVTKGDAVGSKSCMLPILIIGVSLVVAGFLGGTYGIAISALGMLSFVGTTVSIDAFGPIADNAGGLAESCHLDEHVREITDKLDSVGNTTAAVGKGFAIGSAAFATVSLIVAFAGNFANYPELNIPLFDDFIPIAGAIVGGALIEFFSALLTDNTIQAAKELADVGDKQLSDPDILAGKKDPDYNELVRLATQAALRRMLLPSIIAICVPLVAGALFGLEFVMGILLGATIVAIPRAIFMGNSGGAFDNAKKYIESGALKGHGKGSAAHKAAVTGDTIGDTRKDVVGVALDIFIKMMSTVSTTLFAVIYALYRLFWK